MMNDEVMNYDSILNYVKDVVKYDIPKCKFSPCSKCSTAGNCCGCPKYDEYRKFIEDNPILEYEQKAIDFINKLKTICNY